MRFRHFVIAAVAAALFAAAPAAAQVKIGVFNPVRVTEETAEGQRTQLALQEYFTQRQAELQSKQSEIQQLQQQLQQQALSLSIDKRASMELDIQRRLLELNTSKEIAQQEYQLRVASAEQRFNEKLRVVLDGFARAESFDLLLDSGAVAWTSPAVDVTTAIIERFNAAYPAEEPADGE